MQTTIVRYKVKPDKAGENKVLLGRVFEELDETSLDGLRFVAFSLADGVSFVHVSVVESESGEHPLQQSAAYSDFIADIDERCEDAPVASSAEIVGSYRLFWQKFSDTA